METQARSEKQIQHWFHSLPDNKRRSELRQFYHLFCDSSDGDLRTKVNNALEAPEITWESVKHALGERHDRIAFIFGMRKEFKDFVNTIGN